MIRFTRELLLGLTLMATGYALTRIGRWMQQVPTRSIPHVPRRPIDVYESMFMDMPEMAEWLGPKHDPQRWN